MLDGASRLDEIVQAASVDGQPALGITDHRNMYGVLPFYRASKEQGISQEMERKTICHLSRYMKDQNAGGAMPPNFLTQVEILMRAESFTIT